MQSNTVEYYLERAETERALADAASDQRAAAIHKVLAEEYARRAQAASASTGPDNSR